jgi:hypothetical protein
VKRPLVVLAYESFLVVLRRWSGVLEGKQPQAASQLCQYPMTNRRWRIAGDKLDALAAGGIVQQAA